MHNRPQFEPHLVLSECVKIHAFVWQHVKLTLQFIFDDAQWVSSLFWQAVVCDVTSNIGLHFQFTSIKHDKFTTAHVDPLLPNKPFRYHGPEPQRIMTSQEIIRPGLTDRPCDFLPPKSTRQWPRHPPLDLGASAPFFWDCRTSGSWCCGRVRLKYLIFPFFVLPLPSPHIILWFQCPAAVSDRKAHGALWKMYLQKLTLYGNFTTGTRLDLAMK